MLSRAYQNNFSLPRWAYLALALVCAGIGLWSSVVTLQFFEHGAAALENDPALQALAVGAALLFVFGEMAACVLAALLDGRAFQSRRWILYGFAATILGVEIFTISSVQMATVTGADMTQTSLASNVAALETQIGKAEKNIASISASAEALRADKQTSKALKADGMASAEQDKVSKLYEQLAAARTQKRPTLTGMLGEKTALSYAIARGILVTLSGLVFFGTAGVLLRAARGGAPSVDQQILELLHELRGTPAAPVPAFDAPADALPAPALAPADAPADALTVRRRSELGRLLVRKTPKPSASEQTHSAPTGASEQTHPVTRKASVRQRKSTAVAAGAKCDTGTGPNDGARYRRVKAAVQARTLAPGLRAIQQAEGGGAPTVRGYLTAMCGEGIIRQLDDGTYELVGGAK